MQTKKHSIFPSFSSQFHMPPVCLGLDGRHHGTQDFDCLRWWPSCRFPSCPGPDGHKSRRQAFLQPLLPSSGSDGCGSLCCSADGVVLPLTTPSSCRTPGPRGPPGMAPSGMVGSRPPFHGTHVLTAGPVGAAASCLPWRPAGSSRHQQGMKRPYNSDVSEDSNSPTWICHSSSVPKPT